MSRATRLVEGPRVGRQRAGVLLAVVVLLVFFAGHELGPTGGWDPPIWRSTSAEGTDDEAAAAAQEFLRLVADSRRDEDTAPLPCTWVTGASGLLNPCMDALRQRWNELEPIEKVGPTLEVRGVTSSTETTAIVTDADISPRPEAPISISLERVTPGLHGWKVRQLNQRGLPR